MRKLFYESAYIKEFRATVTSCAEAKGGFAVTLDKTAFYPEGGGQPYDTGFIGETKVNAVHERGGEILHYTDSPIETGVEMLCGIDWERRFAFMQGHTGEHILSGIMKEEFGLANVGFHMGSEFVTVDIDGTLNAEQLSLAEKRANKAVYSNVPVRSNVRSHTELETLDYRSKGNIEGDVRIVHIEGFDTCACCGIHCGNTGEIGTIKIVDSQKYKSGMRLFLLCGERALDDYTAKNNSVYDISRLLSAKPGEIVRAVEQLQEENANLKSDIFIFKNRVFSSLAEKIPENPDMVCVFENGLTSGDLRKLCQLLCERAELAAVFSGNGNEFKYALGSKKLDSLKLAAAVNAKLDGKGGGKKGLVQGTLYGNEQAIKTIINNEYNRIFANS